MKEFSKYIGLDVHNDTIAVSLADAGRSKARYYGTIKHTSQAVSMLLKKIIPEDEVLGLCYEAGLCGYGLYRQLTASGHECHVVAPTLIHTKSSPLNSAGIKLMKIPEPTMRRHQRWRSLMLDTGNSTTKR